LRDVPLDDLRRAGGSLLSEAIARLRRGEVIRDAGYDGEYGTIRLFETNERNEPALFSLPNPDIIREMRLETLTTGDALQQLRTAVQALAAARGERDATVIDIRAAGELLTPLARRCGPDLGRFRTEISLGAEPDALDPRAEAITLLTLHAAKGLEFDVVFLAGCEKGLLPFRPPTPTPAPAGSTPAETDIAEERRLLFVGLTRARARLLLTCATRRTRYGYDRPAGRSPFLTAIDPSLLGPPAPPRPRKTAGRQLRLL
jgi:superfamily I DNA/RNA helicase